MKIDHRRGNPLIVAAQVVFILSFAGAAVGAPVKYRVQNPAVADSLIQQGARLVENYGSFQVLEGEPPSAAKLREGGGQLLELSDVIELNARKLNTRAPESKALRRKAGTFSGRHLHLVQFAGPIKPEWRQALEKTGTRVVDYLPHNAYLVYGDAPALERLQSWAGRESSVQWEGPYENDFKILPKARGFEQPGTLQSIGTDTFAVQLVADEEANAETESKIDQWKLRPVRQKSRVLHYRNLIVSLPPERLADLAAQPDVISIQPYYEPRRRDERQDQILAGNLSGSLPSGPGYLSWLASKGFSQANFDASGFVVDVSDSGIDNGSTIPGHFGLYKQGIPSSTQNSRVAYTRLVGTAHLQSSTLAGCDGHGNLNAHIIAGYDSFGGFPYADGSGYSYGLGVCPFVDVGSSVIFDNSSSNAYTFPDFTQLQTEAYNSGARISNNSWGAPSGSGSYDQQAQSFDSLVRDVGGTGSSRQMVIVFVAGNEGPGANTIDSPGSAKNVITVGAAENVRSLTPANGGTDTIGSDGCGTTDSDANSADAVADFSSRGPCADGRMKPDLVAPGTHITGGVGQSDTATNGLGSAIHCFDGSGVAGLPGPRECQVPSVGNVDNFFPLNQQFYTVSSGTSHAAPAVSGACALLRQFFINNSLTPNPPSPAMTKAYLINCARYLTGANAGGDLWSASQGMGEVNLGAAFDGTPRILRDQLDVDKLTASGQSRTLTGFINDPSKPLRATIAWTDAPGSTAGGKALVNDLDLTLTIGGITYKGNNFSGQFTVAGGTADSLNNVESIFLPAGHSGFFTVTITAANIAADAILNGASAPEQDFALVVDNAAFVPTPVISVNSYTVVGESCTPTNGVIDSDETVTVNFALQNLGAADSTNLVVTLQGTGGVSGPSGPQTYGALVHGGPSVAMPFTFTTSGSCGQTNILTFQLQDGSLDLGTINTRIPLGTFATAYAQNFDGDSTTALPSGWSTSAQGAQRPWTRSKSVSDSPPFSAFSPDTAGAGVNALVSTTVTLPGGPAELIFRNKYNLEASDTGTAYDGGVLEIKIGEGSFTDILDAGGSFASGGYDSTIATSFGNPLSGRQAWSGDSGGFITTIVTLPAAAEGKTIQFQWRCGSDAGTGGGGWNIDSVAIKGYWCCPSQPPLSPFIPVTGSYSGIFYQAAGVDLQSSGAFTVTTTSKGSYSASVQMGASRYHFSGRFDAFGAALNHFTSKDGQQINVSMQMDTADNSRITGTLTSSSSWSAGLRANRAVFSPRGNPSPNAGKYDLIIPGSGDAANTSVPLGDGYAALTVDPSGTVRVAGTLADGTRLSQNTKVSPEGDCPVYFSFGPGKGQILGWLSFTTPSPHSSITGWFSWIKVASSKSQTFRDGFNLVAANVVGSALNPLLAPVTGFSQGTVQLTGGGLSSPLTGTVNISLKNKATASTGNKLLLSVSASQGVFKGSILPTGATKPVQFNGAILQDHSTGSGYFLNAGQSGIVTFVPN